jgi:hypothetical protein
LKDLKIFDFRFSSGISFPQTPEYPIVAFSNLYENLQDICGFVFIAGINSTGDKSFTDVNDTDAKLSLVSLLSAINYCPCC